MEEYRVFFAEMDPEKIIWEINMNDIELVAGMLAAGIGITEELDANSSNRYVIDSDDDVSDYCILTDVPEEYLTISSVNKIREGEFGIWLKGSKRFVYNLYRFRTNTFFQGILSICSSFNVDFRNYLYGYPFDKDNNQYALSGYIMVPYQEAYDAPDMDDLEEEEQDDENINEPLARTDDIITVHDYGYIISSDA